MNGNTIFHVEFATGAHHYFGSIAAIFEIFDPETLGVSRQRLYDHDIDPGNPYRNKICIIRKGTMIRKKGKRKTPNKKYEKD